MSDYIDRLREEVDEVQTRLNKLADFIQTDSYLELPQEDISLLAIQSNVMLTYVTILNARLNKVVA